MNKPRHLRLSRPKSARAVARRANSLEEFGHNLRDWFHELRAVSTRAQLLDHVRIRPPSLARRFEQGQLADAFLAAQAEWLCNRAAVKAPRWTRDPAYVLPEPWFAQPGKSLRRDLLLDTPDEFRNRNLFTIPETTVTIRRGRPADSDEVKREKARLRQQRHRARSAAKRPIAARAG